MILRQSHEGTVKAPSIVSLELAISDFDFDLDFDFDFDFDDTGS